MCTVHQAASHTVVRSSQPAMAVSGALGLPLLGALSLPLLLAFSSVQWGIMALCIVLLILGLLRLDLQHKRRKDQLSLQHMSIEYEALQNSLIKLEHMEALLRQQLRMQERLITAIMHDVKSPLYYLLISARALSRRMTAERDEFQTDANAFYDATERMYHLIDNLLQYVKLHAQNKHNIQETISLHELVGEKISIFVNMAATRNISILNIIDPALTVQSDRSMLAIILHNLLDNAIKFTEEGIVRVSADVSEHEVKLIIEDSGVGMHAGWMNWVNEPYDGKREALHPAFPAENGLGLIIVKELLAEINGKLHMHSSRKGTVAEIIIAKT